VNAYRALPRLSKRIRSNAEERTVKVEAASAVAGLEGSVRRRAPSELPRDELSERELAVLRLVPTRLSQREIGASLYFSVNTVKTHTKSIFRKLGVSTRAEAVARARELGLV
jgi:LuxR family transcriptional regulator, maltose regulon positive regulatory protein